ncbi:hypothetical protein EU95_0072 [Prochlorococcus marinus str. MIT 9201]|uniref:Uncharacterized protein n=1 Tax=Prochlorococcus marinus str. MIT 9201 TaxID=93057 RepID=A0A0A2AAU5_PROMR|nr:hypothetical protein EU95_0072 [Prochlorococcus marinus str. MIT 9201]
MRNKNIQKTNHNSVFIELLRLLLIKIIREKNEATRYSKNWSHSKGPSSLLNQSNHVKPINDCP